MKPAYRAWVEYESSMYEVACINWMEDTVDVYDGTQKHGNYHSVSIYDVKLMQYTRKKDKNETKIFNSDIINTPSDKSMVVKWCEKYASFCLDKKGWMFPHWFGEAVESENCEIVGNIYENPDLIS